jgi:tRNA 2-thiouridine synthesizing protein C
MTGKKNHKKIMIINRHAPYGSSLPRESLDVLLACAAFGQNPSVLFTGDGVLQLVKDQQADSIEQKNLAKSFPALAMYDVNEVFVDEASMTERQLSPHDLVIPITAVSVNTIQEMMGNHDVLLSF